MSSRRRAPAPWLAALALSLACSLSAQPRPTVIASTATDTPPPSIARLQPTATRPYHTPTPSPKTPTPSATPFPEYDLIAVTNEAGSITATIPRVWADIRSLDWTDEDGRVIGHTLRASTDIDAFLAWKVEGVAISVSRRLRIGYIELLDREYERYEPLCGDPFQTFWDEDSSLHRGKSFVLTDCGGVEDGWLSVMSMVPRDGSGAYVAEVFAYDMPPTFGGDFRDILLRFEVVPDRLP